MSGRLRWARGDRDQHFIAHPASEPSCTVEIWWRSDTTEGAPSWMIRINYGAAVHRDHSGQDRQKAADDANRYWPDVVRREQTRVARKNETLRLEAELDAAHAAGRVSVTEFELGTSSYDRLLAINTMLVRKGRLGGALKPLAAAVSAELYRRRVG